MSKKLTKNQQLFIDKTLEFTEKLYSEDDNKINEVYKNQKKNRDDILTEIAKILLSCKIVDSLLSLTLVERKILNLKLGNIIDDAIKSELKNESNIMKDILSDTCLEKYSTNNYIYSLGTNFKLTQVPDKVLDKIINGKIDSDLWSDRLWSNKNEIAKNLKVQVKKFLQGDINVNDIEKVIKTKYNTNATNTNRLVKTEITRVQSASNDYWAKEHNINQQLFMATLDSKTSDKCRGYDGQVFDIDDSSKPVPPLHPYCRSCLVNLPNKDWNPKQRYDNQNKQNINWTTYNEWKDNQES
ncbi:minor capsid protein [Clostridium saccharobutylicum]|uniref:Phage putative head morphogenesis protein, SPP1 gp7 family n=1 Tax=Clostridium saccharobutylicum DSM 13864 TaxID=1345695 RepID=U5MX02_CLOSA|nr:minor capsid protein [Clostridium saccharobutylicum]AGX43962.1 phage putative head morphogenesis protein, SPP1 gp7 family [Clostridium saccharobutylicum DSM 13864]AQR91259.1 phage Mu protein F like protein [Clostridium saccharobutylicum]AQS01163.1 phage Mu protein F like protein [Clostridium saccharobutylicum]AQS10576.1 phage Mu protein F like protein [Clostridium saccharobutylicum]AQS15146.1 phage Mu protein F like protein [Clostridium saccharobutylicum]